MLGHWYTLLLAPAGEPTTPPVVAELGGTFGGIRLANDEDDEQIERENQEVLQLLIGIFAMDEVFA